jgi:ABC-type proline/glycine betaine transport system permease subunit
MTVLNAVGLVVLAGIAVVALLAVLLDRARKAIEQMGIDPERL